MKTLKTTLTVIFAVMTTVIFANTAALKTGVIKEKDVSVSLKNPAEVIISLPELNTNTLIMEVYDNQGELVMNKSIKADRKNKISHDLSDLSKGFYTYVLKDEGKSLYSADVIKGDDCALEVRNSNAASNASIVKSTNNMVKLNINNSEKTTTTFMVKDDEGNIVFNKKIRKAGNYKFSLDISELDEGSYSLEVYHKDSMIACSNIAR